ncbi:EF-P 5-aminopentanol modification-associated protein YfmH [Halanaerobium hydrogeniformans]|uniref:Peptidase M16 domain protein n=1 Tax=Halanaerobium hydrogeniformans TaxID=656519 RepID=E4RLP2_HALHG|nr:pitrilysin family protein [Halanaerobium hydrogeniformans]ADQ14956.1 peptidase M16 domain protein [Halanaerobium hydrogeniformans]
MQTIYNQRIDEKLIKTTLENGLNIYIFPKKDYVKQYAMLSVDFGSNDIEFIDVKNAKKRLMPEGIAHFLEHQLFEDKEKSIFDKFADLGASANAYTNFDSTNYLFSSSGNFNKSLINLIDFVQTPYFSKKNVEKEKGIIIQEIKMYQDNPYWRSYFNLLSALYINHPVKNDIAGTVESVSSITPEDLYICYYNFYQPSNMDLILIGDIDEQKVINLIKENQAQKSFPNFKNPTTIIKEEPAAIAKKLVEEKMKVSRPMVQLAFKDPINYEEPLETIKKEYIMNILLDILFGRSSKNYNDLYEKGYIDDSFSSTYNKKPDYAYIHLYGESDQPDLMREKIKEKLLNIDKSEIKGNFQRIKRKYQGSYIRLFNNFRHLASEFITYRRLGVDIFEIAEIIDNIEFKDLLSYSKNIFNHQLMVESIISNKD